MQLSDNYHDDAILRKKQARTINPQSSHDESFSRITRIRYSSRKDRSSSAFFIVRPLFRPLLSSFRVVLMSRCRFLFSFRITPRVHSPFARAGVVPVVFFRFHSPLSALPDLWFFFFFSFFFFLFASLFRILIATTFPTSAIFLAACIKVDVTVALWFKETRKERGNQAGRWAGGILKSWQQFTSNSQFHSPSFSLSR